MIKDSNVTVMVSDIKSALKFYTETLGFKAGSIYGEEWAEVKAPGLTIGLHPLKGQPKPFGRGGLSIGFSVDDLDEMIEPLKKKGIDFNLHEDVATRLAFFADRDGNPLYFCEVKMR
jgi:catechol 2,3-dioxygenase-like lactoylglutathione lyase family enzyme